MHRMLIPLLLALTPIVLSQTAPQIPNVGVFTVKKLNRQIMSVTTFNEPGYSSATVSSVRFLQDDGGNSCNAACPNLKRIYIESITNPTGYDRSTKFSLTATTGQKVGYISSTLGYCSATKPLIQMCTGATAAGTSCTFFDPANPLANTVAAQGANKDFYLYANFEKVGYYFESGAIPDHTPAQGSAPHYYATIQAANQQPAPFVEILEYETTSGSSIFVGDADTIEIYRFKSYKYIGSTGIMALRNLFEFTSSVGQLCPHYDLVQMIGDQYGFLEVVKNNVYSDRYQRADGNLKIGVVFATDACKNYGFTLSMMTEYKSKTNPKKRKYLAKEADKNKLSMNDWEFYQDLGYAIVDSPNFVMWDI